MTPELIACPQCLHTPPRWLEAPSSDTWVNYYRRDACSSVWTTPKGLPLVTTHIVADGRLPAAISSFRSFPSRLCLAADLIVTRKPTE